MDEARDLIWNELELLKTDTIDETELQKLKNTLVSSISFSEVSILHKAINLAYFEMLGDAEKINHQEEEYNYITGEDLNRIASELFRKENCSELIYLKKESRS